MSQRSVIVGCGSAFPQRIVTNNDLSKTLDTTDTWIQDRTGIRTRRIAAKDQSLASLAAEASQNALNMAHIPASDIDAIILATTTPDHCMPATATQVQHLLGASHAFAFDIQAVCSGFLYALSIADHFIQTQTASHVLVIGADIMSRVLDWNDRSTCILFGDGAGTVLLQKNTQGEADNSGILSTHLFSDGAGYDMLYVDPSVSTPMQRGALKMNGRAVFSAAIENMVSSMQTALTANNLTINDINWFIAHQANKRIIENVAVRLGLPFEKVILTIDRYANTSAATIPTSLTEAVLDGRIQKNDIIALSAMGSGFTWGSAIIRWK